MVAGEIIVSTEATGRGILRRVDTIINPVFANATNNYFAGYHNNTHISRRSSWPAESGKCDQEGRGGTRNSIMSTTIL